VTKITSSKPRQRCQVVDQRTAEGCVHNRNSVIQGLGRGRGAGDSLAATGPRFQRLPAVFLLRQHTNCGTLRSSPNIATAAKVSSKALLTKTPRNPRRMSVRRIRLPTAGSATDKAPSHPNTRHALGRLPGWLGDPASRPVRSPH